MDHRRVSFRPTIYSGLRNIGIASAACVFERPSSHAAPDPDARSSPRARLPLWAAVRPLVSGPIGAIESCIPALRRYGGSLLRDRQEVDDLVHDCLVRALDRMHTRRTDAEMRPWLFAIMHNLHVSRTRQRRTRGDVEPLDAVAEAAMGVGARQEDQIQTREVL